MKNHYHLLISPVDDDVSKISLFMKKLNMGYARFFNEKHERSGYLWQGKYKKIHIQQDSHFQYIPFYIHLNPLDYFDVSWRNGSLNDIHGALSFLEIYRWSSFLDYHNQKNFPSLINRTLLDDVLGSAETQIDVVKQIVSGYGSKLSHDPNIIEIET